MTPSSKTTSLLRKITPKDSLARSNPNVSSSSVITCRARLPTNAQGDAYDKPAKTETGAMTTNDSSDAATIEGTSADPNAPGSEPSALEKKAGESADKAGEKAKQAKDKKGEAEQQAQGDPQKEKMMGKAEEKANKA
ncbi:hypothetical protein LTR70_008897 [Exophiala xenobiotica]|uniref:Uncharacterized protein n=1 Tax=Lithohypha guttulata TaxID=1690604 RepID=A0ABR0JYK5_9EURO|nr:hypothetical protein LTR24_008890 [Lithohypha guttulata]KAK5311258.1 hypothetical protein LTR70_008897 [Exophiala xenobiotica]